VRTSELILIDSPPTHLIELETSGIEIHPRMSKGRHCSSLRRINREPPLQLSKLISFVKSKPKPSVFIAFWAASKRETPGDCAITQFECQQPHACRQYIIHIDEEKLISE